MRSLGLVIALLPSKPLSFPSPSCSATPECAVLNLVGDCCPHISGNYLDCCTPSRQCSNNHLCAARGLGGLCCPNDAGHLLDCCSETKLPLTTAAPRTSSLAATESADSQIGLESANNEHSSQRPEAEEFQVPGGPDIREGDETKQHEKHGSRFGPLSMIGFLLLLICIPGLCCWICWIRILNKRSPDRSDRARALPEIMDMESVSAVSTRTEATSQVESSACQVQSDELYLSRDLKETDVPMAVGCCPHVCSSHAGGGVVQAPPLRTDPRRTINSGYNSGYNSVLAL